MIRLIIILLAVGLAGPAWAAPDCADPSPAESHVDSVSTSVSVAYTTRSGSNQILFFGLGGRSLAAQTAASSVQIGGNNMTELGTTQYLSPAYGQWWYYVNPPTGTNNATATLSAAPTNGNFIVFVCNNVDTADPFRSSAEGTGNTTTPTSTPASVTSADTVIDFFTSDDTSAPAAGANQTDLVSGVNGSSSGGSSYQAGADGGVMDWTTLSDQWTSHSTVLKPTPTTALRGGIIWFY